MLGTFIATFLYCLLVLRTVRGTENSSLVPHLSVAFGALLAIASAAVLIYFIHHIATSIRIETLLAHLAAETRSAVDRLYPERMGQNPSRDKDGTAEHLIPGDFEGGARQVRADGSGYVERIGVDALMRIAIEHDLVVRIEARPGRFVSEGDAVLAAYPRDRVSDEIANDLGGAFVVGLDRTPEQDLEFSIRRIVELAQRSLSPGINDPTTALYCIDRLGEVFGRLADREIPSPMRFDEKRQLRIVTEINTFGELALPRLRGHCAVWNHRRGRDRAASHIGHEPDDADVAIGPRFQRPSTQAARKSHRQHDDGNLFDNVPNAGDVVRLRRCEHAICSIGLDVLSGKSLRTARASTDPKCSQMTNG